MPGQPDGDTVHAIGALARRTAHDLNNCMSAVMSFADIVLESLPAQHPLRGEVHGILSTGRRVVLRTRELDLVARKLAAERQS